MMADVYLPLKPRIRSRADQRHRAHPDRDELDRSRIHRCRTPPGSISWRIARKIHAGIRIADHRTGAGTDFRAAYLYGRAKAGFIGWTMGVNHSTKGTETVNAINNLALLTGNIGRAGASPFSITGQCNAMGTREAGFTSRACPATENSRTQRDREELAALWGILPERTPNSRGLAYPDIIEAAVARKIRALWIIATNPHRFVSQSWMCSSKALETWNFWSCRTDFIPRRTSEMAHLVLPAASGEKKKAPTPTRNAASAK